MRSMLLVLDSESPHRKAVNSSAFQGLIIDSETTASLQLGRITGYEEAIRLLKTLGTPAERRPNIDIPTTYTDTTPKEEGNPNG